MVSTDFILQTGGAQAAKTVINSKVCVKLQVKAVKV